MALFEIVHRIANTEAGQAQLNYERAVAMMDAYGGMYRSMNKGMEFSRLYISARTVFQYDLGEEDED